MKKRFISGALALVFVLLLAGCGGNSAPAPTETAAGVTDSPDVTATADMVPKTLEEYLLKQRGVQNSDYKTVQGGEGIIDITTEFDFQLDYGYSTTTDCIFLSGNKLHKVNFNTTGSIQTLATLPRVDAPLYWKLSYDGEMGDVYYKNGEFYSVRFQGGTYTFEQKSGYPIFSKVYRYSDDGKSLVDATSEFLLSDKVYSCIDPIITLTGGKVCLLFSGKYLDKSTTGWNWYRDMGWRQYIAFDLDTSLIGSEKPLRLFNRNILMTDKAFYEIVYASEPLDESDAKAQLAPDGSVSPYYPAKAHLNCNLTLRKIDILTEYYSDVLNICTSHVITKDMKLLPIKEVMTQGYSEYITYDPCGFYRDILNENVQN